MGFFNGVSVKRLMQDAAKIERAITTHGDNIANAMADRTKAIAEISKELDMLATLSAQAANLMPALPKAA